MRISLRTIVAFGGLLTGLPLSGTSAASETLTYTYDALGRLVVTKSTGTVNSNQTHSICYDKAGNRISYIATSNGLPAACVTQG